MADRYDWRLTQIKLKDIKSGNGLSKVKDLHKWWTAHKKRKIDNKVNGCPNMFLLVSFCIYFNAIYCVCVIIF